MVVSASWRTTDVSFYTEGEERLTAWKERSVIYACTYMYGDVVGYTRPFVSRKSERRRWLFRGINIHYTFRRKREQFPARHAHVSRYAKRTASTIDCVIRDGEISRRRRHTLPATAKSVGRKIGKSGGTKWKDKVSILSAEDGVLFVFAATRNRTESPRSLAPSRTYSGHFRPLHVYPVPQPARNINIFYDARRYRSVESATHRRARDIVSRFTFVKPMRAISQRRVRSPSCESYFTRARHDLRRKNTLGILSDTFHR